MSSTIEIEGPAFFGQEDENIFFECLYRLPKFKGVEGKGTTLSITLDSKMTDEIIERMLVICHRWEIDASTLQRFKNEANAHFALWD